MTDLAKAALSWLRLESARADLSLRQVAALGIICDGDDPIDFRVIAKSLGVSKPVVTRAVRRLSQIGLVAQDKGQFDRRLRLISATPKGRELRRTFENV